MDFKRVEIRRVVRHYENLASKEEIKSVLLKIKDMKVPSSIKVMGYPTLGAAYVLEVGDKVSIFSRDQKLKVACAIDQIIEIEVFSNSEMVEEDQRGRWTYI